MNSEIFLPALTITITFTACVAILSLFIAWKDQQSRSKRLTSALEDLERNTVFSKKSEKTLRSREKWFRVLFNSTRDMVFVYAITADALPGDILEINDLACVRLGYTREKLLSMTPLEIEIHDQAQVPALYPKTDLVVMSDSELHSRQKKIATSAARRMIEQLTKDSHIRHERVFQRANGTTFPAEVDSQYFMLMNKPVVMCTARDITARKETETALKESKQHFHEFMSNSPIGIAMYNSDRELLNVNKACLRMLGIPGINEFKHFNMFNNKFLPSHATKTLEIGDSTRFEMAIDFTEVLQHSMFITSRTGHAWFDVMMNNMGLDHNYRPRGYFAQIQDITERRLAEAELCKSEQQLRQAEKMEAIGSMAGGIAHDFNNILTPILGYAKMILRASPEDEPSNKYAQKIQKAGNRAKELVSQILTFSRKSDDSGDRELKAIRIAPIAKEVLQLQGTALPDSIRINRILKSEKDVVLADPTKIHQILMNLCTNAGHAMKENGGILELRITDFTVTKRANRKFPNLVPGPYLRISVKDTGVGMDQSTREKIFEPFFTTKKSGEGTGMGLSVVLGIIAAYKGTITVESEVGVGSIFHVILPIVEMATEEERTESESMPSGNERILIIDDERDVTDMISDMLESIGYETATVNQGFGALKLLEMSPDHFDLVITDQVMPGITGTEIAQKIFEIRPNMPVILCTGFSGSVSLEQAKEIGIKEYLTKPIVMDDLANAIRKALGHETATTPQSD